MMINGMGFLCKIPTAVTYTKNDVSKFSENLCGCYMFESADACILYIGKSKNIKSRVQSHIDGKTHTKFYNEIEKVHIFQTDTELSSSLLELALLSEINTKYNIKDTQTFTREGVKKLSEHWRVENKFFLYTENESTISEISNRIDRGDTRIKPSAEYFKEGMKVAQQFIFDESAYRVMKRIISQEERILKSVGDAA